MSCPTWGWSSQWSGWCRATDCCVSSADVLSVQTAPSDCGNKAGRTSLQDGYCLRAAGNIQHSVFSDQTDIWGDLLPDTDISTLFITYSHVHRWGSSCGKNENTVKIKWFCTWNIILSDQLISPVWVIYLNVFISVVELYDCHGLTKMLDLFGCLKPMQNTVSRRHPDQRPEPPQLVPFSCSSLKSFQISSLLALSHSDKFWPYSKNGSLPIRLLWCRGSEGLWQNVDTDKFWWNATWHNAAVVNQTSWSTVLLFTAFTNCSKFLFCCLVPRTTSCCRGLTKSAGQLKSGKIIFFLGMKQSTLQRNLDNLLTTRK